MESSHVAAPTAAAAASSSSLFASLKSHTLWTHCIFLVPVESGEWVAPVTKAEARLTAGRIIPAIATTTACITGFVQVLNLHKQERPLEDKKIYEHIAKK